MTQLRQPDPFWVLVLCLAPVFVLAGFMLGQLAGFMLGQWLAH
jgi:hypothetical protein